MIGVSGTGATSMVLQQAPPLRFQGDLEARARQVDAHLARTETPVFRRAFAQVLQDARQHIARQREQGRMGFVVFDIDETTLDNRGFFRDAQRQYYKSTTHRPALYQAWQRWVGTSAVPVIPETRQLIDWLNQEGIPYLFLTGIREFSAAASQENLRRAGVWGPRCLGAYYRPDRDPQSLQEFKTQRREQLMRQWGMPVLASIGDRPEDMTADPACNFLLPGYVMDLRRACG